ncbi:MULTISPECIES: DMT family transporter [unclassified Mesorhizobium]|uniref:DMT family transporter n=1 Tax=unclassified Mesorhizobium TaxID=325217 RepID=UPI000F7626CC|nr:MULTISPECIES: DMT family transporter [unclassified Mesorhizobium]AZO54761.1 DMT family transporter [Mesorhizobium sp. M8A.F.Ca.ET.057.01.1.1]RWE44318.1 MAG: DMT family transporter [Mesorhizobium sp.]TJX80879.1 MAG: DMT family transporter [Mesorhizobium sp.]
MSKEHSHLWPGVPLALGSAALFGAVSPLSKVILEAVNPIMLAGLLYLGAGLGLGILWLSRRASGRAQNEAGLQPSDVPWLCAAIAMGGVVGPVLLVSGLALTTASSAALLLNVEGLATMAIAWLVFRENVDRRLLLGAGAILCGAIVLSWTGQGVTLNSGALLVVGACAAWGIDNNLTRKISAADPVTIATLKGLVAGTLNVSLALLYGSALPQASSFGAAAAVGFLGVGVSLVMFILALRHLGTARTGAYYSLAPFIGALLAILLLGEPVTVRLLVAGALMAVGLYFHLAERHEHEHEHEALEHEHSHVHDEHHDHPHDGPVSEPHSHRHSHVPMTHKHPHYPDLHHRHEHH